MPTIESLTDAYCTLEDVVTELNKTDSVDNMFSARASRAIVEASRLIDDYCCTQFYKQDFSSSYYDLRYKDHLKDDENLYLSLPIGSISEVVEDDITLTASEYLLNGVSKIIRLDSSGDPQDWGSKIKLKAKFGYATPANCNAAGWSALPRVIRSQCAVFAVYLMGERKAGQKTKEKTGWENRDSSYVPIANLSDGATQDAFAFVADANQVSESVKTYTGNLDILKIDGISGAVTEPVNNKTVSLGYQAPTSEIETVSIGYHGLIPVYEYNKLDPYRFLGVSGL